MLVLLWHVSSDALGLGHVLILKMSTRPAFMISAYILARQTAA